MAQAAVKFNTGRVEITSGSLVGHCFLLPHLNGKLTIGSASVCNIQFDPVRDPLVAKQHAYLEVEEGRVFLWAIAGRQVVFLDGERMSSHSGFCLAGGPHVVQLGGEAGPTLVVRIPENEVERQDAAVHLEMPFYAMQTRTIQPTRSGTATIAKTQSRDAVRQDERTEEPAAMVPEPEQLSSGSDAKRTEASRGARSIPIAAASENSPIPRSVQPGVGIGIGTWLTERTALLRQAILITAILVGAAAAGIYLGTRMWSMENVDSEDSKGAADLPIAPSERIHPSLIDHPIKPGSQIGERKRRIVK